MGVAQADCDKVARLITRVALEVLSRPELDRVDEDADYHHAILAPRELDQAQVAGVEGAHRGHQPDRAPLGAPPARSLEHRAGPVVYGKSLIRGRT